MLINLKLATHAFRCSSQQIKFGVQSNLFQSVRNQMTQSNVFSKNQILNQQNRNVITRFNSESISVGSHY